MTQTKSIPRHEEAYAEAVGKLQQRICALLEWNEMEYAQFIYQTGIAYLHWYLPSDDRARKTLERSKLYWNWFKQQWHEYDFIYYTTSGVGLMGMSHRVKLYNELHCPRALAVEVKPNNVVLSEIKNV